MKVSTNVFFLSICIKFCKYFDLNWSINRAVAGGGAKLILTPGATNEKAKQLRIYAYLMKNHKNKIP